MRCRTKRNETMLAMTDEMLQNTEDFTATLGSLTITQQRRYSENCNRENRTSRYDTVSRKTG